MVERHTCAADLVTKRSPHRMAPMVAARVFAALVLVFVAGITSSTETTDDPAELKKIIEAQQQQLEAQQQALDAQQKKLQELLQRVEILAAIAEPSATPIPEPTNVAEITTPPPQPAAASSPPEGGLAPTDSESMGAQPLPETDDEVAKKDQVTNPGDVAFADYTPFDLDSVEPEPIKSKWQGFVAGVRGMTRYSLFDGDVKFRLGLSFKLDGTAGSGTDAFEGAFSPIDSDVGFRFGIVYAAGRIKDLNFSVGLDLGADPGIDSAWVEGAKGGLEIWGLYLGKLRLGFVGEPFSLERQGSTYNTALMERSLPVQAMAPGYNVGVLIHDSRKDKRLSWAAGIFSIGQNNEKNASNSLLSLTGRVTYLPVYRDDGNKLVHLGLSASIRSPTGSDIRYRSRPEARFVEFLVDTGNFAASHVNLWGVEAATVNGPLWASAEFILSDVSSQDASDPVFRGGYVQVGWFITGENRPYQTNGGTFGRVLPRHSYKGGNPFKKGSGGAWELTGRISHLDLNDGLIEGGALTDFSAGLSWYVDPTFKVMLNYIYARPKDRGSANIIVLRTQFNPW